MVNINLLPPEERAGAGGRGGPPSWLVPTGVVLALGLVVTSLTMRQVQEMSSLRDEIAQMEVEKTRYSNQLAMIAEVSQRRDELSQRLHAAQELNIRRGEQVRVMTDLVGAVPSRLWLVSFKEESAGRASIQGRALNLLAVFEFMSDLERSSAFAGVSLTYLKRDDAIDGGTAEFMLQTTVR
jgi:Tfp pilus assembly protein PilN